MEQTKTENKKIDRETGLSLKCPDCGGTLEFDSASQMMKCPYCNHKEAVPKEVHTEQETVTENNKDEQEKKTETLKKFTCKSCGAELLTDEHTTATFCSYCGSANLMESRMTGQKMPEYIIPFKIDKQKAKDYYREWAKKGILTPAVFRREATIDKISGIYVPFWMYDYGSHIYASGECTKVRYSSDADYNYTHTEYYYVERDIYADFEKIPADASDKMEDGIMDKLEPYNYKEIKPFSKAYLSGYLSEKYNKEADQYTERIEVRVDQFLDQILDEETKAYTSRSRLKKQKEFEQVASDYALLPVWILNYRYRGKNYVFALNGQTGKIVAEKPIHIGKAAAIFVVMYLISFIICYILGGIFL